MWPTLVPHGVLIGHANVVMNQRLQDKVVCASPDVLCPLSQSQRMTVTQAASPSNINAYTTLYKSESHEPSELIILCTWLGAHKKHIAKYIALYEKLAPRTSILLIESAVGTITPAYSTQRQMMANAVTLVRNVAQAGTTSKILLHAFSNGGSNSASQLLQAYRELTDQAIPLHGMLIDSAPGKGEYWKSYNAIRSTLPRSRVWNILGPAIAHAIPLWMYTGAWLGFYPTFEQLIWDTILDERLWRGSVLGNGDGEAENRRKIAYLWGKMDRVICWEDIVQHSQEARNKMWHVRSEEFAGSGHCEHFRMHADQYEGVVRDVWMHSVHQVSNS
jgi:hypothetical protein